jgi:hypothetical protein
VDWDSLFANDNEDKVARMLRIRGKNQFFLSEILYALRLDKIDKKLPNQEFKRRFTPEAVAHIYEAACRYWPDAPDYERALSENSDQVTALYTGSYEPDEILRAISRHALYADHIYLIDPFFCHKHIARAFNPLIHPERNIINAIKYSRLWLAVSPWIDAGLVSFIRPITDFHPTLDAEARRRSEEKMKRFPELAKILEEDVARVSSDHMGDFKQFCLLSEPDEVILRSWRKDGKYSVGESDDQFLEFIRQKRNEHPYFVDVKDLGGEQLMHQTSGASYEIAKEICAISGSHLITDLRVRWKEIELDREKAGLDEARWSPFSKAFQGADLKILENVPLELSLKLRKDGRLDSMRQFLRKVWKQSRSGNEFDAANCAELAAELAERVREAEDQWKEINRDLVKFGSASVVSGMVATASTGFLGGACVAGAGMSAAWLNSSMKRRDFGDRYPAGFFLGLRNP